MARRYCSRLPRNKPDPQQSRNYFYQVNRVTWKCSLLLFLLALIIAGTQKSVAEENGPSKLVRGVLTTLDGNPLSGATVEIFDHAGVQVARSVTDSDGQFAIVTDAAAGEYQLIVTNSGQLNAEWVQLGRTDLNIKLAVSPVQKGLDQAEHTISARQLAMPSKTRARIAAAQKKFDEGNISGAIHQLNTALTLSPSCSEAWSMRAFIRLSDRDLAGAIRDASRASELDRNNAEALVALGTALNSQKSFDTAESNLRRALALNPGSWQAQLELAKAWYGQKRFVMALRQLDLIPRDFPDIHLVRANILMNLGRKREGAEEFEVFLRAVPGDRRAAQIKAIMAEIDSNDHQSHSY